MKGGLINQLCDVSREDVSSTRAKGRVPAIRVQLSGHEPLAVDVTYGSSVYYMTCEKASPWFGFGSQKVKHQIVHVNKYITVCFHDILRVGAEREHPSHAHESLQGQIVV